MSLLASWLHITARLRGIAELHSVVRHAQEWVQNFCVPAGRHDSATAPPTRVEGDGFGANYVISSSCMV